MQLRDLGRPIGSGGATMQRSPRKDLLEVVIRYVLKAIAAIGK